MDRCSGHCCKRFTLFYSPDELKAGFEEKKFTDIEIIYPMVRLLGTTDVDLNDGEKLFKTAHIYTCIHLQENNDCGIYETRPKMCKTYPEGRRCLYEGCTWDAARQGLVQLKSPGASA